MVHTYSRRHVRCASCGQTDRRYLWSFEKDSWACPCGGHLEEILETRGHASAVIGDEIDVTIRHGICHDDGTPQRFRSRSELRRIATQKGYTNPGAVNGPY